MFFKFVMFFSDAIKRAFYRRRCGYAERYRQLTSSELKKIHCIA